MSEAAPSPTRSDQPRGGLAAAGRKGARWGALSSAVQQTVSVLVTFAMARLLTPADFGIVAAATVVVSLLFTFAQTGYGLALVRRDEVDDVVASTTIWTGLAVGAVVSSLAAGAAPLTTRLLSQPDAAPYLAVLGIYAGVNLAVLGHRALLQRALRFKAMYSAEVVWSLVYGTVALSLAATTDLGAWCMVIGQVGAELSRALVIVGASRFRPLFVFDRVVFRQDLRFNASYLGASLTGTLSKQTDNFVVSRTMGAAALGNYYVAFVLPQVIRQRVTTLTTEILIPVLARTRDDGLRQRAAVESVLRLAYFVLGPVLAGLAVCAPVVVEVVFGPQWDPAADPLALLCIVALIETYCQMGSVVMLAHGEAGRNLRASVVRLVVLAVGLGVVALAIEPTLTRLAGAVVTSSAVASVWFHRGFAPLAGWRLGDTVRTLRSLALSVAVMGATVVAFRVAVGGALAPVVELAAAAAIGASTYLVALLVCDRRLLTAQLAQLSAVVRGR